MVEEVLLGVYLLVGGLWFAVGMSMYLVFYAEYRMSRGVYVGKYHTVMFGDIRPHLRGSMRVWMTAPVWPVALVYYVVRAIVDGVRITRKDSQ